MEEETLNHFIGQCPKRSYQRGGFFDSFYLSVTDIVDKFSLPRIIGFIQRYKQLNDSPNADNTKFNFFLHLSNFLRGQNRAPMPYLTVAMIYSIVIMTTAPYEEEEPENYIVMFSCRISVQL